jgi:hypothetical protein
MSFTSLKKLWSEYGIGCIFVIIVLIFVVATFTDYLGKRGGSGMEFMSQTAANPAYKNSPNQGPPMTGGSAVPKPAEPLGQNEVFSSVSGIPGPVQGLPTSCTNPNIQNPSDLLPRDTNSQWAQLNPSGKGELANINLLRAGYHYGIDTIGSSLRNANLQIRSEPPNPQLYTGPWQQSTITPDFMRPPLELGVGQQ